MEERFKVYIKGVQGRGNEVIKALTDLGVENRDSCDGKDPKMLYFLNHSHGITRALLDSEVGRIIMDNYREILLPKQWRDGDLLAGRGGNLFAVFSYKGKDSSFVAYMQASKDGVQEYADGIVCSREDYRLATDDEIVKFYRLLHKHGRDWDPEKKKLVKWKWKPKFGEQYWVADATGRVDRYGWEDDTLDNGFYNLGNCFATRKEAEAMAKKFKKLFKGD
ncbi:MAG: hypothetical protein MSS96_11470 [Bacteroidales bacterium]|nr:hypothetical protein [Bacteroidales bacterium]